MGRAFEYRKARKLKRWGHMARVFTKIGKEIEIAVKSAGPDPSANGGSQQQCRVALRNHAVLRPCQPSIQSGCVFRQAELAGQRRASVRADCACPRGDRCARHRRRQRAERRNGAQQRRDASGPALAVLVPELAEKRGSVFIILSFSFWV